MSNLSCVSLLPTLRRGLNYWMNKREVNGRRAHSRVRHNQTETRDLPKLLGQELQAHFKPLRELPHRMFTLLLRLKNIRGRAANGGAPRRGRR